MASEQIKQMFVKRMFEKQDARRAGDLASSIFGRMGESKDVHRPDASSPFGSMNVETQTTPATGLFQQGVSERDKFMRASREMVESGSPMLQKQGLGLMSSMQGDVMGGADRAPITFAMGSDERGKMQRASLNPDGSLNKHGSPYDPRDPMMNLGTHFQSQYDPNNVMKIELAQKQFEEKRGISDQAFLEEYNVNVDKGESSLESYQYMLGSLDELANSATGWTTGWGSLMRHLPDTDAGAWQNIKAGVLSNLGLEKIGEMKAQSSTGATGMGALNEKELALLVEYRGQLAQDIGAKQIKKVVGKMQKLLNNSKRRIVHRLKRHDKKYDRLAPKYGYDARNKIAMPKEVTEYGKTSPVNAMSDQDLDAEIARLQAEQSGRQ
jgi:hypothetical protein